MGAHQSSKAAAKAATSDEVNFDHFQILRAIGRGSFGKVCIVQKKDSNKLFAMKYMNKRQCAERATLHNVLREVDILRTIEHPFLVNLWFSFQDEEDLFLVSDLLLGGDLRYHVSRGALFTPDCVLLYVCELAAALDFLQTKRILHRDIKPDNILLDEEGHVHLTDFNIAIVLESGQLATSMSGTKPYMAPEIFSCAVDECAGYSFPVDWWSLGICAYEMLQGTRPFDIHSATSIGDVRALFNVGLQYPSYWSSGLKDLISRLLCTQPGARISSFNELKSVQCLNQIDINDVLQKKVKPSFVPPKNHLNCDPTYELEEMIIEAKPLHKKKKRLAKQRSLREIQGSLSIDMEMDLTNEVYLQQLPTFKPYNREVELVKQERESKELKWEEELLQAMEASNPVEAASDKKSKTAERKPSVPENREGSQASCQSFCNASLGNSHKPNAKADRSAGTTSQRTSVSSESEKLSLSSNQRKTEEHKEGICFTKSTKESVRETSVQSFSESESMKVPTGQKSKLEKQSNEKQVNKGSNEASNNQNETCRVDIQQTEAVSDCGDSGSSFIRSADRPEGDQGMVSCSPFPKVHIVKACVTGSGR